MLFELRDGHVNLTTANNRSRNHTWRQDFPDNFNPNFTSRHYLGRDYYATGSLPNQILPDSIGYMTYRSFSAPVSDADLDFVLERFDKMRGIIFDVRDNGGGSMATIFRIMSRFVDKKTAVGYFWQKNGRNHNDFGKRVEFFIEPKRGKRPFLKPVMLLTNRGCYSATNFFAGFMSQLPQVTLIGDRTGGGGGLPISADLPNGWQYRFSATYTTLLDGFNIEHGVAPDLEVATGAAEELQNKDAIIERAILEIKKGK